MNRTHPLHSVILRVGACLAAAALSLVFAAGLVAPVSAATFGTVVPIGGQAADIALDEPRGLLYIANFTANQIDVMSLSDNTIHSSISVAPQPGSLALSPDGNYLVIVHFGNFAAPAASTNALTVIYLNQNNALQTFALGDPPLGVAFGIDGIALIVTTTNFILFDPTNGQTVVLDTIANVTAHTLPVPPANFPTNIVATSLNVSADGFHIYGLSDTIFFHYSALDHSLHSLYYYTAVPPLGPRAVSVSADGSYFTAGWAVMIGGIFRSNFPFALGTLNLGTTAINSSAGLIYAQLPQGTAQSSAAPPSNPSSPSAPQGSVAPPILQVVAADNLAVQQNLQLAENTTGKSILSSKSDMMYSVSDSGVTVFPVGYLNSFNRVQASKPDLVFRGNLCSSNINTQQVTILDPGGNQTDFTLTPSAAGVYLSQYAGTTPATITVTVDPAVFQNQQGTVTASIKIGSGLAINVPDPIRVLINSQGPEQRGTFVDVPGTLVDVLADPVRNRFYVLRQDQNEVYVFDSTGQNQIAVLRTGTTPTSMAITMDSNYLLIGHDNAQLIYVFNLNTLQPSAPVVMASGHQPRQVAVSSNAILAASRVAGPTHTIDYVDFLNRTADPLPSLGVFKNDINIDTALSSSPSGRFILATGADGTTYLYDASSNSFVAGRKDFTSLSGAHSASDYGTFLVNNSLLNQSLVAVGTLDASIGASSGAAFRAQTGFRTTTPAGSAVGVIEEINPTAGALRPTEIVESPLLAPKGGPSAFTRTLAPLADQSAFVSLTTSGFTMVPWNYSAAVTPPYLKSVVNAADFTKPIAPGGLIALLGSGLGASTHTATSAPWPTVLADTCLMLNGSPIPMTLVSGRQITAQLPFNVGGSATLALHTPGGSTPAMNVNIQPNAPAVFRSGTAGPVTGIATVYRNSNRQLVTLSNPIHVNDTITIYATGLGAVKPTVATGSAGPAKPLAVATVLPTVSLGGVGLILEYAGLAPGLVGVDAIELKVPGSVPTGISIPLVISQGGVETTLSVRVVK